MSEEHIRIDLPLPCRTLNPNGRTHWAVKAKAKAAAREEAKLLAFEAQGFRKLGWRAAHIDVTAYYRDRRRHDQDNLLASAKAQIDGIVDSGLLLDDDRITYTIHPAGVDKARPRLELTITRRIDR